MNLDFLSRLYWACTDDESTYDSSLALETLYERLEDAEKAAHFFTEKLYATNLSNDEKCDLDMLNGTTIMEWERQGFINGFRLGMKLAGELGEM